MQKYYLLNKSICSLNRLMAPGGKNGLSIAILFILLQLSAFGQQSNAVNIASPNAQSLFIARDYPVSNFTGTPDIGVPLYSVKLNGLSVPIALTYNHNAVRADTYPGWVGLGWNLTTGGAITRVVNGNADDSQYSDMQVLAATNDRTCGFYWNYNSLAPNDWSSTDKLTKSTSDYKNYSDYFSYMEYTRTVKDYAPDEFNFSFLGYSGSFYLNHEKQWKVRSSQHFKVEEFTGSLNLYESNYFKGSTGFIKFILTDDAGVKYVFGEDQNAIEFSTPLFQKDEPPTVAKTWNLVSIIFPDKQSIKFNYKRGNAISYLAPNYFSITNPGTTSAFKNYGLSGTTVYPSYLEEIITPFEKIRFYTSPTKQISYTAGSLTTENNSFNGRKNNYDRQVQFDSRGRYNSKYDPYFDFRSVFVYRDPSNYRKLDSIKLDSNITIRLNYNNLLTERLKLLSVSKVGRSSQTSAENYSFTYNSLPANQTFSYLHYSTDYWGYENGKQVDLSSYANYLVSKQPDSNYTKADILNTIIYPTGGYTTFKYELNSYLKSVQNPRNLPLTVLSKDSVCGGLRIKQISNFDTNGSRIAFKNYFYDKGHFDTNGSHLSSGVLGGPSAESWVDEAYSSFKGVSYSNLQPSSYNSSGSHIGYSEVTEESSDGGYNVYKYSNFDNGSVDPYMDESFINQVTNLTTKDYDKAYTSHSYERGRMLSVTAFNSDKTKVKKTEISYTHVSPAGQEEFVRAYYTYTSLGTNMSRSYKINTFSFLKNKEIVTDFLTSSDSLQTTTNYQYDSNFLNVKSYNIKNSKQQTLEVTNRYPNDMVNTAKDILGIYTRMVDYHITAPVVESIKKLDGSIVENNQSRYYWEPTPNLILPWSISTYYGDSVLVRKVNFEYNSGGKTASIIKNNFPQASYIWGYNNQYPVAEAKGAQVNEIYHAGFEEVRDFPDWAVTLDSTHTHQGRLAAKMYNGNAPNPGSELTGHSDTWLQIDLQGKSKRFHYAGWVYSDGPTARILLFMKRTGEQAYFTYVDGLTSSKVGQWEYLEKDFEVPADVSTLNLRIDNNGGGNVWFDDLRLHPSEAQMTTYTYDPLSGMTSTTNGRGETTYYEYDEFRRLKRVLDQNKKVLKQTTYHYQNQ